VFANPKFKGRMTMLNDVREVIGAALLTLGYNVNTIDLDELNKARDLIITWKQNLAKFESEQYKIGLATNEYFIAQGYNTDIGQLQEEIDTIDFIIPKEGGIVSFDTIALPKGAQNSSLAYEFMSYLLDPKVAALNVEQTKGLTPVIGVKDHIDTVYSDNPIIFPSKEAMARCQSIQDIGENIKLYNRIWDQIKISN
jgi:spermidine/putrescine transport system substrate-binding protein